MTNKREQFAVVFGRILTDIDTSTRRAARLSGVSRRTLENWITGRTARPRDWRPIVKVAKALRLTTAETDRLLNAAGHPPLAQLEPPLVHLPTPLTPFIGRKVALQQLVGLLCQPQTRLVTIAGLGGVGKTRMAIAAARQSAGQFADGVYFVSLEGVTTVAAFWTRMVAALQIGRDADSSAAALAQAFLQQKSLLLVLDNFEELWAQRVFLTNLLQKATAVTLLVTSRVRLDLQAEQLFPLLGFADADAATALFIAAARRRIPDYTPDEETRTDIHTLCAAVEGMPLAIELAATWVEMVPPAELIPRIQQSPDELAHPAPDRPQRQHSMQVVLDATWGLLSAEEQQCAVQLSPLQGTFTTAAALAIGAMTLPLLRRLMQCNIVQARTDKRLAIHELVRQFLAGKATADVEVAYITYYLQQLAAWSYQLRETLKVTFVRRIAAEWQQIERAWWLAVADDCCELLIPCIDIVIYFDARTTYGIGRDFLTQTRDRVTCRRLQARCDEGSAFLSVQLYDALRAEKAAKRALATFAAVGKEGDGIYARVVLCWIHFALRREASDHFLTSLLAACGQQFALFTQLLPMLFHGAQHCQMGAYTTAIGLHEAMLALVQPDGYHVPIFHCVLGLSYEGAGDIVQARAHFEQGRRLALSDGAHSALLVATYALARLDAPNAPYETRLAAVRALVKTLGTPQVVGNISVHLAMYYLAYGGNAQAYELARIGLRLLRGEVSRTAWTATAMRIGRFFFFHGVVQTLPAWLLPVSRVD